MYGSGETTSLLPSPSSSSSSAGPSASSCFSGDAQDAALSKVKTRFSVAGLCRIRGSGSSVGNIRAIVSSESVVAKVLLSKGGGSLSTACQHIRVGSNHLVAITHCSALPF